MIDTMLGALFSALVLAALATIIWTRLHRPRPPLGWTHVGEPPPGADAALEILRGLCPGMRWGGTVEWRSEPWPAPYDRGLLSGQVLDLRRHRIRCASIAALPWEVDHLRRRSLTEDHDTAWIALALEAIRERLG